MDLLTLSPSRTSGSKIMHLASFSPGLNTQQNVYNFISVSAYTGSHISQAKWKDVICTYKIVYIFHVIESGFVPTFWMFWVISIY